MNYIKLFVASPDAEFPDVRNALNTFTCKLNNACVEHGIYVQLQTNEPQRMLQHDCLQEDLEKAVSESDLVYLLVDTRVGSCTLETFETALEQRKKTGSPDIFVFFHELSEDETPNQTVTEFQNRLEQLSGYSCHFKDADSIKMNILFEIMRRFPEVGDLCVKEIK